MKRIYYILLVFSGFVSCQSASQKRARALLLDAAHKDKIKAQGNLVLFKVQSESVFKEYDSLKKKGSVPYDLLEKHDSLFRQGQRLIMDIVHAQMKVDSIKKMP